MLLNCSHHHHHTTTTTHHTTTTTTPHHTTPHHTTPHHTTPHHTTPHHTTPHHTTPHHTTPPPLSHSTPSPTHTRTTNVPIIVGWSHTGERRTSGCERGWARRTCENRNDDAWKTRAAVPTLSSLLQLLRNLKPATAGCKACESAHGNKHWVRCEARRHEYRLKYGRNPLVATRRVYHEPETVREGAGPVASETNPGSVSEREPAVRLHRPRSHTLLAHL